MSGGTCIGTAGKSCFCVQPFEASITEEGFALSQQGNTPDVNVSFSAAQAACQKTVLGGRSLRVINHREWKQAGGGGTYPWGKEHAEWCVLDSPKMHGMETCTTVRKHGRLCQ